ncbi:hypothetical protein N7488_006078 [Penicillium malachiteum]|nr:hypothetical protein N7488_006078 [Penicillium malachiteum]
MVPNTISCEASTFDPAPFAGPSVFHGFSCTRTMPSSAMESTLALQASVSHPNLVALSRPVQFYQVTSEDASFPIAKEKEAKRFDTVGIQHDHGTLFWKRRQFSFNLTILTVAMDSLSQKGSHPQRSDSLVKFSILRMQITKETPI